MNYNNKIQFAINTTNEFGEAVFLPEDIVEVKCHLAERNKVKKFKYATDFKQYDLKVFIPHNAVKAYVETLLDPHVIFFIGDKKYSPIVTAGCNDLRGRTIFYEIDLEEIP